MKKLVIILTILFCTFASAWALTPTIRNLVVLQDSAGTYNAPDTSISFSFKDDGGSVFKDDGGSTFVDY